ncbi:MAG: transporter substrate-binding domain-containing protein [Inhella sp.]
MKLKALLLALCIGQAYGTNCTQLVFSANPNYPPFHWSERGQLVGASIELTERIFKELGVRAEPRYLGPWNRVLRAAEEGQLDLVVALKITPEREAFLAFTPARFSSNPMAVFVRSEHRFAYRGWDDLIGRTGLVARGDRFGEGFDEFLRSHLKVLTSHSMEDGFANLLRRHGDYLVTGYFPGRAYLAGKGLEGQLEALSPMVNQGSVHHGFVRRSPCAALLDAVSERLRAYEADGSTERLRLQYLDRWRATAASRVE